MNIKDKKKKTRG